MNRFFVCLGLTVALLPAACSSPNAQDGSDATPAEPVSYDHVIAAPGDSGASDAVAAMAPAQAAAAEPGTPRAPSTQDADLEALMERARAHAALRDDRTNTLVEAFLSEGLMHLENGDAEAARDEFGHALQLDPRDPVANELYDRVGLLLGDEDATLAGVRREARLLAQVREEAARGQVQLLLDRGRTALADGDPTKALGLFQDAHRVLSSHPELSSDTLSLADVASLVEAAKFERNKAAEARDAELARRASEEAARTAALEANSERLRIVGLLNAADDAFLADDYDAAVANLDEVLRLDRGNADALNLRSIVTQARNDSQARDLREVYADEWRSTFRELEQDVIVPNDLITHPNPELWAKLQDRGNKSFGNAQRNRPRDDLEVEQRLAEVRIPVNFQGEELDAVLAQLSSVAGLNFIMSPDVEDALPDNQYTFVDKREQSIERILRVLLEDLSIPPMTWTVRDGIVRVITQTESRGDYILDFYNVHDLTFIPIDHPSKDFNLIPSGTDPESYQDGVEDDDPIQLVSEDTLVSLIQDYIQPDTWSDDPERSISSTPGQLVVKTTPDVHDQIRSLLADLRRNTTTMINIETRLLEVEDSFLEDIGVDIRGLGTAQGAQLDDFGQPNAGGVGTPSNPSGIGTGIDSGAFYSGKNGDLAGRTENLFDSILGEDDVLTGAGGFSLEALFLDDTNVNAVLRAVSKYQTSNIVNAPSLTLRSGQRGTIQVISNRAYVRDFEPEIAQAAVIAQPELAIVKDGIVLDVRAVASGDKRFVTLELRPTLAQLIPDATGDLLPEALVSLGTANANNVTVQLPELSVQRVRTTATIPDGATLLLGGLKTSVEQDFRSETPFFADIPVIGSLFKREGEYVSKRKLLILLTATIIAPEEHEPNTGFLR